MYFGEYTYDEALDKIVQSYREIPPHKVSFTINCQGMKDSSFHFFVYSGNKFYPKYMIYYTWEESYYSIEVLSVSEGISKTVFEDGCKKLEDVIEFFEESFSLS
jgi:hypothetical protein